MKKIFKMIFVLLLAMLGTSIAISIFVGLQLGSDTLTVLLEGVHISGRMSLGAASRVCNITLLLIAFLLNRKEVKLISVLFTFLVGFVLDFVSPFIVPIVQSTEGLLFKSIWLILAQACISFGFAILIKSNLGMQSLDAIIYFFTGKFKFSYVLVKLILDGVFLFSGWLLGGTFGVGTIISLLTTGIMVRIWLKILYLFQKNFNVGVGTAHDR